MRIIPNEPKAASCLIYFPNNCKVSTILTLLWHAKNYCRWCCLVFSNGCSSWKREKRKYLASPQLVYFLLISSPCWLKCESSAIRHQNNVNKGWQKHIVDQHFALTKNFPAFSLLPLLFPLALLCLISELGECFAYGSVLCLVQK